MGIKGFLVTINVDVADNSYTLREISSAYNIFLTTLFNCKEILMRLDNVNNNIMRELTKRLITPKIIMAESFDDICDIIIKTYSSAEFINEANKAGLTPADLNKIIKLTKMVNVSLPSLLYLLQESNATGVQCSSYDLEEIIISKIPLF